MRKIALVNQKGGVGKTTSAVNLAAALARLGARVLIIDLDPQSNTTIHLGLRPAECKNTTYALLSGRCSLAEAAVTLAPKLRLLPSNIELAGAEMELAGALGREHVLTEALGSIEDTDFVLIDCPPSLGLLNVNGLTYADEIFIPLQCEFFALQGISLLMRTLDVVRTRLNPDLDITGVIACMLDLRKSLSRETLSEIERHFGDKLFKTRIRSNVRLAEAPGHGKTIFQYAPDSYGAEDYHALAREVLGLPAEAPEPEIPEKIPLPDDIMKG